MLLEKGLTWSEKLNQQILSWRAEGLQSPHLAAYLLDMYEEQLEKEIAENSAETLEKAIQVVLPRSLRRMKSHAS